MNRKKKNTKHKEFTVVPTIALSGPVVVVVLIVIETRSARVRSQLNVPAPGKIETRVSATDRPRDLHVRAELWVTVSRLWGSSSILCDYDLMIIYYTYKTIECFVAVLFRNGYGEMPRRNSIYHRVYVRVVNLVVFGL